MRLRGSATGLVAERLFQRRVHQFVMPGIDGYEVRVVVMVVGGKEWVQAQPSALLKLSLTKQ